MSVVLVRHRGDLVTRFFIRSAKAGSFVVSENGDIGLPPALLSVDPMDAFYSLGLAPEARQLEQRAQDWRWLGPSELAAAFQQHIQGGVR